MFELRTFYRVVLWVRSFYTRANRPTREQADLHRKKKIHKLEFAHLDACTIPGATIGAVLLQILDQDVRKLWHEKQDPMPHTRGIPKYLAL